MLILFITAIRDDIMQLPVKLESSLAIPRS